MSKKAQASAVILLALAWASAEHLTSPPNGLHALVLSLGGLLVFVWSSVTRGGFRRLGNLDLVAVAVLAGWQLVTAAGPARYLYVTGLVCLLVSLAPHLRRSALSGSLSAGGLVLILSGASGLLLKQVAWRLHCVPLGIPTGSLQAWTGERLAAVAITFEALGLYVIWYLAVTLGIFAALSHPGRGWAPAALALVRCAGVVVAYAGIRLAATAVLAVDLDRPGLLWHSGYAIVSWFPLSLLLDCPRPQCRPACPPLLPVEAGGSGGVRMRPSVRSRLAAGAVAAAGLCAAFAATFNDPGVVKQGRVLIDNGHSNWEWTTEPFDTTAFGIRAEYNYRCLQEYLSHFYTVSTAETISSALEDVDVLIIKTPTTAYSDREIESIVEFVEGGGGLLLVGDHTNLFGMTTYLNAIATPFGMRFGLDDTFDLATTGFSTYLARGPALHPAARNLRRFDFLTSCTITGGILTEPAIVGCGLASEDAAYSHPNFFGNVAFDLWDRFGVFLQAASMRFGKGRVFLFSDSTCLSNFCLFRPGTPDLVLGAVDYVNRKGLRHSWARPASLLVAAALAGMVAMRHRGRGHIAGTPWLAGLVWFLLGIPLTAHLNAAAYGRVSPVRPLSQVVFDTHHSGASFFDYLGVTPLQASQHFEEFYLCAQRLGLHPKAGSVHDLDADTHLALVIVNPNRPFAKDDVRRVFDYVAGGGVLLVLDSVTNSQSTAAEILRPFGLEIQVLPAAVTVEPVTDLERGGQDIVPGLQAFVREPGSVGVRSTAGGCHILAAEAGSGRVLVAGDAFRYSASVLGRPLDRRTPARRQQALYREIFTLYEYALVDAIR